MLPKALKSCPKSNKLPNLVTLIGIALYESDNNRKEDGEKEKERMSVDHCIGTRRSCELWQQY